MRGLIFLFLFIFNFSLKAQELPEKVDLPPKPDIKTINEKAEDKTEVKTANQDSILSLKPEQSLNTKDPLNTTDLIWMSIYSLLVIILLAGFLLFIKKMIKKHRFKYEPGVINVYARRKLSLSHELYLIGVGSKVFLLGSTKERLNTLGEFSTPSEVSMLRSKFNINEPDFPKNLSKEIENGNRESEDEESNSDSIMHTLNDIKTIISGWKK